MVVVYDSLVVLTNLLTTNIKLIIVLSETITVFSESIMHCFQNQLSTVFSESILAIMFCFNQIHLLQLWRKQRKVQYLGTLL